MKKYQDILLVDGYNIIHSWPKLVKLTDISLEAAREKLIEILSNYQGFKHIGIIVVFDAHKIKGGSETVISDNNVFVVYTKEAETADQYIERVSLAYTKNYKVTVATSDYLEQIIIMSKGALRLSARELLLDVHAVNKEIERKIELRKPIKNNQLKEHLDPGMYELFEKMRRNKF